MQSKTFTKESTRARKAGFLSNYFKRIGISVMLFALGATVVVKTMSIDFTAAGREVFKLFSMNAFILGLLFIACAKDKVENQITVAIRIKAMARSFVWTVLFVIIKLFVDLLFRDPVSEINGQELIVSMLLVYLLTYYIQKKGISKVKG